MRRVAVMAICGLVLLAAGWRGAFDDSYFAQQAISKTVFYGISADQYWTNTFGVTQVLVKVWGAGGWGGENGQYSSKGYGGGGGFAQGYVSVTNNEVLTIIVGDGGLCFLADTTHEDSPPNYGGGGGITRDGIYDYMVNFGGGRSAVRRASGGDIITGGGGGSGAVGTNTGNRGAAGGGTNGLTGTGAGAGGGGTQLAGGAGGAGTTAGYPGTQYTGGNGITYFGGGGGGYYGGGGGGYKSFEQGSGGGGSAYIGGVFSGFMIAGGPDWIPANTNDVDYIPPYAEGGYPASPTDNGKSGLVVISWP